MEPCPPPLRIDGPLLVFGGPYSNLQATRALRAEAERLGIPPRHVLCTGDVVAYGADPAATVALVRDWGIAVIAGNVEEQLGRGAGDCGCGFGSGTACDLASARWYRHADAHIDDAARAWMRSLPARLTVEIAGLRLAGLHGGATATNRFHFPSAADSDLAAEIDRTGADGVLCGHSGLPFTRLVGGRLWHNAGVIGLPADDGTPRVWYGLLTPTAGGLRVEHRPLDYDWRAAQAAMQSAGLPCGYADALGSGLWPSDDILPAAERLRRGQRLDPPAVTVVVSADGKVCQAALSTDAAR